MYEEVSQGYGLRAREEPDHTLLICQRCEAVRVKLSGLRYGSIRPSLLRDERWLVPRGEVHLLQAYQTFACSNWSCDGISSATLCPDGWGSAMGDGTSIEWTEATWNPVSGCSKVSPGCTHCYAEALSLRFGRSVGPWTRANAAENVRLHPERLDQPSRWRRPRLVFVNSMSDLFHELVPAEYVDATIAAMYAAPQHTYQILTKRPERARDLLVSGRVRSLPEYAWLGVSIENSRFTPRADVLREAPVGVRFISAEPLLGSLFERGPRRWPLNLTGIDWVIAGGESGHRARPVDIEWVRELRDACQLAGVSFFFKQWGGRTPKAGGRTLDGALYSEMPAGVTA